MKSIFDELTAADGETDQANVDQSATQKTLSTEPDPDRTDASLRAAAQQLLASGLIEATTAGHLYQQLLTSMEDVNRILEPLDLYARADDVRGLVYLAVRKRPDDAEDEWSHPLVRRQRLTLEQSLLVAILRQYFISYEQDSGIGRGEARVTLDELMAQLQVYLGDPGSESKERKRLSNLLDQLKGHGLVGTPDAHGRVEIRPMIAHVANPENLKSLLADFIAMNAESHTADGLDDTDIHTDEEEQG